MKLINEKIIQKMKSQSQIFHDEHLRVLLITNKIDVFSNYVKIFVNVKKIEITIKA